MAAKGECVGVLLAGGGARRFGGVPKGLARIEGSRIADRVLAALDRATVRQLVVANDPRARLWFPERMVVKDAATGLGPLAGLRTALTAAEGCPVLVVAWDMPFVTAELLRMLRDHGAGADASCAPVHGSGNTVEALCAYYRTDALDTSTRLLTAGERRAHALFDALAAGARAVALPAKALERLGDPARLFRSVDSAADLADVGGEAPETTSAH